MDKTIQNFGGPNLTNIEISANVLLYHLCFNGLILLLHVFRASAL